MPQDSKPRVLVFIVAYNAEKTVGSVIARIPRELRDVYEIDVLIIDDASTDATFARSHLASLEADAPFRIHALFNPVNLKYGGNQKLGYHYAIENGYDFVALLHGDGQYAPECLPALLEPLRTGAADVVFGSRMLTPTGALKGGMPLYKFAGNRILTWFQNKLLRSHLSEFHSGYRVYSVAALKSIPFERNSNDFHFDTEIIIQLLRAGIRIKELPIPTYYGDEICHVNGLAYAAEVVMATVKARLQEFSLFYDARFDCAPIPSSSAAKLRFTSPHTLALERIPEGSRVLDLGCADGYMSVLLQEKKRCSVTGVDVFPPSRKRPHSFLAHDLNTGVPPVDGRDYDTVLMLDIIEHLNRPEQFLDGLRQIFASNPSVEILISTGNVAFGITRAMLLLGQFNYGKRGILDLTHTRLFTFGSLRRTLRQAGFEVLETRGVPAPFALALGDNWMGHALLAINQALIRVSRGFFSYQIFMRIRPEPTVASLLRIAGEHSRIRAATVEKAG